MADRQSYNDSNLCYDKTGQLNICRPFWENMFEIFLILVILLHGSTSLNLVQNGDFDESEASVLGPWVGNGGKLDLYSNDSHGGSSSLRAFDR